MAGEIFRLKGVIDLDNAAVNKGLDETHSKVSEFGSKSGGIFSSVKEHIGGMTDGFAKFGLAVEGVKAGFEVVKGIGSLVGIGALNEMEQTRASFMAFTKDAGKTEELLAGVRKEAALTPFAFGEMAKATASLLPVAKSSGASIEDLRKQAEILAASNPLEGLEGASFSLREAMTGDFTSIIERFNLSRTTINKLKAEGVPNLEIVRRAMAEMGFDSDLIAAKAETLDGRWSTFQDTLVTLQTTIGQPIFDALKEGLVSLQGILDGNMDTFQGFADLLAGGIKTGIETVKETFTEWLPTLQLVGEAVSGLFTTLMGGEGDSTLDVLDNFFPPETSDAILQAVMNISDLFKAFTSEVLPLVGPAFQLIWSIVGPILLEIGTTFLDTFNQISGWFLQNLPLIKQTIQTVLAVISALWKEHGETIMTVLKLAWDTIRIVFATGIANIGDVLKIAMQLISGDWSGAWDTITSMFERNVITWESILRNVGDALFAVIDHVTGGALTKINTWLDDTGKATREKWDYITTTISDAWGAIKDATQTAVDWIDEHIGSKFRAISDAIKTVHDAIKNVITAVWNAIYDNVIKPKLDAISTYFSTKWEEIKTSIETKVTAVRDTLSAVWEAVKTKVESIFGPILTYIRDTIFEPIRAAIETKINAARDLFGSAIEAIKTKAEAIFGPLVKWWNDTIWEPMRKFVYDIFYGQYGIHTTTTGAVDKISSAFNGVLQTAKNVWETTWGAIKKAAESPAAAMEVIIRLVDKLKSIMPEWLIPHSPTPFQIGLEGIMKAARQMDAAFGNMSGGSALIAQIAGIGSSMGGVDFGRAAAAISASETGNGASLVQRGGTGAVGPFQFDPGGELKNFAKDLHVSLAEAARIAVAEPGRAIMWALNGYLGNSLRAGQAQGLSGAALAMYGSRFGQRPFGDNWKKAGEWYERLFPGLANGGIVSRPTLAMLGERGAEAVVPLSRMGGFGGRAAPIQTHIIRVMGPNNETLADYYVTGREVAIKTGRAV